MVYIFAWFSSFWVIHRIMIVSVTEIILDLIKHDVAFNPRHAVIYVGMHSFMYHVGLSSVETRLFHGIARKHSKDPCQGDFGLAWFIGVEIEAAPGFPMSHLPPSHNGRSPNTSPEGQNKSQYPESLLYIKTQYFWNPCPLLQALVAARPTWSRLSGKRENALSKHTGQVQVPEWQREREKRASLLKKINQPPRLLWNFDSPTP